MELLLSLRILSGEKLRKETCPNKEIFIKDRVNLKLLKNIVFVFLVLLSSVVYSN